MQDGEGLSSFNSRTRLSAKKTGEKIKARVEKGICLSYSCPAFITYALETRIVRYA